MESIKKPIPLAEERLRIISSKMHAFRSKIEDFGGSTFRMSGKLQDFCWRQPAGETLTETNLIPHWNHLITTPQTWEMCPLEPSGSITIFLCSRAAALPMLAMTKASLNRCMLKGEFSMPLCELWLVRAAPAEYRGQTKKKRESLRLCFMAASHGPKLGWTAWCWAPEDHG